MRLRSRLTGKLRISANVGSYFAEKDAQTLKIHRRFIAYSYPGHHFVVGGTAEHIE
jgi:hypothetical protein